MTTAFTLRSGVGRMLSSSYARAAVTLSTGQFIAAAIPILVAPVLGRLYTPADYGLLATYMALANVFSSLSTMQLSLAIVTERSDRNAIQLVVLCQWISLLVASLAALLACGIYFWMAENPRYDGARGWMLLLPASVMANGSTTAILMLANRMSHYGWMARNTVYPAIISAVITVPLGALGWGANGLFAGYFAAQIVTFSMYFALYRKLVPSRKPISRSRLLVLARRHRDFAFFTLPSEFIGTFSLQLPAFGLTAMGEAPLLGAFSRAQQLISMPLGLLAGSIGQVFLQRASEELRQTGRCLPIYRKTLLALAGVCIVPTLLLTLLAPSLMRLYLGPRWTEAGYIAQILAPMLFLRCITGPLANVFYFEGHQKEELLLNTAGAMLLVLAIGAAWLFGAGYALLYAYAAAFSAIYIAYLARGWDIARGERRQRNA